MDTRNRRGHTAPDSELGPLQYGNSSLQNDVANANDLAVSVITANPPSIWAFCSPLGMLRALFRYRKLVVRMAWRDVLSRYRGTYLGLFWSFLNPLLMLTVYTLVFSGIFRARWGDGGGANE